MTAEQAEKMDDESLVRAIQAQEDGADMCFRVLFDRYVPTIRAYAHKNHERSSRIPVEDFYSYHLEHFWEATNKFNVDNADGVPFRAYVQYKLTKRTYDIIRSKMYTKTRDEAGRLVAKAELSLVSLDAEVPSDNGASEAYHTRIPDVNAAVEDVVARRTSVHSLPLVKRLRQMSIEDAQFAVMLAQGMSYTQIATALGHASTADAAKGWAKRTAARLRKIAVAFYTETGDTQTIQPYLAH